MKKSNYLFLSVLLFVVSLGAGCQSNQAVNTAQPVSTQNNSNTNVAPVVESNVEIVNFKFQPQDLIVTAGTSVVWKNSDNMAHKLLSIDNFESPIINPGEEFKFTFSKAGVFDYYCTIHPSMTGKIIVK